MTTTRTSTGRIRPSWFTRFWAVVKYEMLWNIRKKKFIGVLILAFVFATLGIVLPVVLSNASGEPLKANPDYIAGVGAGSLGFFLFALVIAMNSISGEFETGTIVPLLTKPVSRTMVFLGKLFAAFLLLLMAYTVLFIYQIVGGTIVYGPQNNLHLVPLLMLGNILSTFVWMAIVLALGALTKNSLITALVTFGVFAGLLIAAPIVSVFTGQAGALSYVPGSGATGYLVPAGNQIPINASSISTGTDSIASNFVNYVLNPSADVTYARISSLTAGQTPTLVAVYTEALSIVLLRAVLVALVYAVVFLVVAWIAFKRAQILE
jgi:ABC-type transport system involved in multi-copper enzyme maturation permease subunit